MNPRTSSKGYHMVQLDDCAYDIIKRLKEERGLSASNAIHHLVGKMVSDNDKMYDAWTDLKKILKLYCSKDTTGLVEALRHAFMRAKDDDEKINFMIELIEGAVASFGEKYPNGKTKEDLEDYK